MHWSAYEMTPTTTATTGTNALQNTWVRRSNVGPICTDLLVEGPTVLGLGQVLLEMADSPEKWAGLSISK